MAIRGGIFSDSVFRSSSPALWSVRTSRTVRDSPYHGYQQYRPERVRTPKSRITTRYPGEWPVPTRTWSSPRNESITVVRPLSKSQFISTVPSGASFGARIDPIGRRREDIVPNYRTRHVETDSTANPFLPTIHWLHPDFTPHRYANGCSLLPNANPFSKVRTAVPERTAESPRSREQTSVAPVGRAGRERFEWWDNTITVVTGVCCSRSMELDRGRQTWFGPGSIIGPTHRGQATDRRAASRISAALRPQRPRATVSRERRRRGFVPRSRTKEEWERHVRHCGHQFTIRGRNLATARFSPREPKSKGAATTTARVDSVPRDIPGHETGRRDVGNGPNPRALHRKAVASRCVFKSSNQISPIRVDCLQLAKVLWCHIPSNVQ